MFLYQEYLRNCISIMMLFGRIRSIILSKMLGYMVMGIKCIGRIMT